MASTRSRSVRVVDRAAAPASARTVRALVGVVSAIGVTASVRGQTAQFYPLGDLPGGLVWSSARAVSADGSVVAGVSKTAAGDEAFRWSPTTGMVSLGDLPGGPVRSVARGMNADGSVIVGQGEVDAGASAFRWSLPLGMEPLSALSNVDESFGQGCTQDGNVIVGTARIGTATAAFRWTSASSFADVLLPDGNTSNGNTEANAVSPDGSWIAGSISPNGPVSAAVWSQSTGWITIGDIPGGGEQSYAVAITDAGDVAAGNGASPSSGTSFEAFRWAGGLVEPLGDLPGGTFQSFATDMSADGSVIIGYSDATPPPDFRFYDAFIWDSSHGMRKLQDVLLSDYGLSIPGWKLVIPFAMSRDGQNIVGVGVNPAGDSEAWLVRLGETCPSDFDHDGFVTGEDFDAFLDAFGSGNLLADMNGDGFLTGDDFDAYVARFLGGC